MTTKELISRVQRLYSKGVKSDDSRLTSRHIYNKLLTARSRLITQELNRRKKVSQWNYQILPCVELIEVPSHECPCLPEVGCRILRTKYKLPKPLVTHYKHTISSVTSIEGSIVYTETTFESKRYKKGNRYTSNTPDYYIKDGYLYITHRYGPRIISIVGLFENPWDVSQYPQYCKEGEVEDNCTSILDDEFPIEADMIDTLIELTLNELINIFPQMVEDRSNDNKDSHIQQTK